MRSWLREIRLSQEITQELVAENVGISRAYYTRIENGKRGEPLPVDTAKKIAAVLNFDWKLFYPDEEEG